MNSVLKPPLTSCKTLRKGLGFTKVDFDHQSYSENIQRLFTLRNSLQFKQNTFRPKRLDTFPSVQSYFKFTVSVSRK
jgi:hypothetical protein